MVPTISLFLFSTGHTLSFASYVAPPWNELRIGKLGQYRLCMRHDPVLKQLLQRESWGAPCWFTDSLGFLWHLSILQSRSTTSPVLQRRTVNIPIRILRSMISADCHQCFREDFLWFFKSQNIGKMFQSGEIGLEISIFNSWPKLLATMIYAWHWCHSWFGPIFFFIISASGLISVNEFIKRVFSPGLDNAGHS